MAEDWPRIRNRRTTPISPWMAIIEREVEFAPGTTPELYHAVDQRDYVAIVAMTPEGRILIVHQYRPALECFTWELPAGLVDVGETPEACCRRELIEETGYSAKAVYALGNFSPCTARLSNRIHSFFVETTERAQIPATEAGIEAKLVTPLELARLIVAGDFTLQLHIGAILLAAIHGHIGLEPIGLPDLK